MARRKPQGTMFQETVVELPFPMEGVDVARAYTRQRPGTSVSAQNVRTFEPSTDRARGGQRHGTVKYFQAQAVGGYPIQDINRLVASASSAAGQQIAAVNMASAQPHADSPPPVQGQFVYARGSGSGFGVGAGDSGDSAIQGTSIWTGGSISSTAFASSCWDSAGTLYVAQVNSTTGAINIKAFSANGNNLWTNTGLTTKTSTAGLVAGMVVIGGVLWVAYLSSGGVSRLSTINAATGVLIADGWVASSGGFNNVASLAFSSGAVNCMAAIGSVLGIDCPSGTTGVFMLINTAAVTATGMQAPVVTNYTDVALNTRASRVRSDGVANFYVLAATTTYRVFKISVAGRILWRSTAYTGSAITDLCYDPTATNKNPLVIVRNAAPSIAGLSVLSGALTNSANAAGSTHWDVIDSDGLGNFVLWRNSVASNDIVMVGNTFSTIWGPSTYSNAKHTGASVNRTPVQTSVVVVTVTNPGNQSATVGVAFSLSIVASDSASQTLTYAGLGLPPGLSMNSSSGVISGVPTASGTTTVTAVVSDPTGATGTAAFTLTVQPNAASGGPTGNYVTVTNPGAQTALVGTQFSVTVKAADSAAGQALTYSAANLPLGLSMNSVTGTISGVPSLAGSSTVLVTVFDTTGATGTCTFSITVSGSATTGGANARIVLGLVASNGEVRAFTPSGTTPLPGGAGLLNPSAIVVWSAALQQQMFYADGAGYNYYDAQTNKCQAWTATAGSMPVDGVGLPATLIERWNGRLVLSGLPNDPANWFMSAQLNPFDFDYSPETTSTTQAVAGNNSFAGTIGDVITCILPYRDDTLLFGCTHSIWQMSGDPADGGQITNISQTLGMAWGRPYCVDLVGIIYFMASDRGIYKLVPGSLPVRISQSINRLLQNVNLAAVHVRMVWDTYNQGLALFLTPYQPGTATTHFFWEERTNSWWPQVFANMNHDPTAVFVLEGDQTWDQRVLLGGRDGYVRYWIETAPSDDGTPIASFVVLGPFQTRNLDEVLFKGLQATLGSDSGQVAWALYTGATPEAALASTPVTTGTWSAGRNPAEYVRVAGVQLYLKISASTPWTVEKIMSRYAPMGRVRQRGLQN